MTIYLIVALVIPVVVGYALAVYKNQKTEAEYFEGYTAEQFLEDRQAQVEKENEELLKNTLALLKTS